MKEYKVRVRVESVYDVYVEAEDEKEAEQMGYEQPNFDGCWNESYEEIVEWVEEV